MMKQPDFIAELKYRTSQEGGRKGYVESGYRPHIEFDHIPFFKSSGQQIFLNKEHVFPGESVKAELTLLSYHGYIENINIGNSFKFYEGSTLIGTGIVLEIINKQLENTYSEEERKILGKRLESAIELAKENHTLSIQNINIGFNTNNELTITGFSKWTNLESITKEKALPEIEELKYVYANWLGLTTKFREQKEWISPEFHLVYLDGKNGIEICSVKDNKVKWMI